MNLRVAGEIVARSCPSLQKQALEIRNITCDVEGD
jgi:hypothetical protein